MSPACQKSLDARHVLQRITFCTNSWGALDHEVDELSCDSSLPCSLPAERLEVKLPSRLLSKSQH